jgi:hypothetical protein
VVTADLRPEIVDLLKTALDELPAPIFVHCAVGQRAAALAILCENTGTGASGDALLSDVAAKGVTIVDKNLISFVRSMADNVAHGLAPSAAAGSAQVSRLASTS